MPIIGSELKFYYSGAGSDANPDASIGGAISANEVGGNLHDLFTEFSSAETTAGRTEYRCIYVKNTDPSISLTTPYIYMNALTPSTDTAMSIALGNAAVGATETATTNETTEPAFGPTWVTGVGSGNSINPATIPAGSYKAIWLRLVVDAGAAAKSNDNVTLTFGGDTTE